MSSDSATDLLVLHAVRLKGLADDHQVAARFELDPVVVTELLLDFEAYGWVGRVEFAGTSGWTLTAAGKRHNQQQLADELAGTGARATIEAIHDDFTPSNARLQRASTDWQVRPTAEDPLAANLHDDPDWDAGVLSALDRVAGELADLEPRLTRRLSRFWGYQTRFAGALARVRAGDPTWINRVGEDSCHTVWMELHEDLLATLGLERGTG